MDKKNLDQEILSVKSQIFDLLRKQNNVQMQLQNLEKIKQEKLKELNDLEIDEIRFKNMKDGYKKEEK